MNTRHGSEARRVEGLQILQGTPFGHLETPLSTLGDSCAIHIDASANEEILLQDLQPLAAPATDVAHGPIWRSGVCVVDDLQIDLHSLLDVLTCAPELILEAHIEEVRQVLQRVVNDRAETLRGRVRSSSAKLFEEH